MSETLQIGNESFLGYVLAGAVLLLAIFIWKEWPGRSRPGFQLRLLSGLIAMASLVCLLLEPAIRQPLEAQRAIICTEGCDTDILDSLKKQYRGIRIYDYSPGVPLDLPPEVRTVWINGYGLAPFDSWQLQNRDARLLPAADPKGIIRLKASTQGLLGDPVYLSGMYHLPNSGHRLILKDPGDNPVDSVRLTDQSEFRFKLKAYPKAAGAISFRIEEQDSNGTVVRTDPWPVTIRKPEPLSVLILNTFPSFETKYLKNFLSTKGSKLLVRNQLTRGAFKFEYINRDQTPLYKLTGEALKDFDLLVLDIDTFRNLGSASRNALSTSIEENGLSLFIQPDEDYFTLPASRIFFSYRPDASRPEDSAEEDGNFPGNYPYVLEKDFLLEPVILADGRQVGAYRRLGAGKVLTTTLKDSYQLLLRGKSETYGAIWSSLLRAATSPEEAYAHWESETSLPLPNAPYAFRLRTAIPSPHLTNAAGSGLPLQQDLWNSNLWRGTDYPERPGWNQLKLEADSAHLFSYFVYEEGDWKALRQKRTQEANLRLFSGSTGETEAVEGYVPIALIWFYLLFLAAMGWLWLEPRLLGDRRSE